MFKNELNSHNFHKISSNKQSISNSILCLHKAGQYTKMAVASKKVKYCVDLALRKTKKLSSEYIYIYIYIYIYVYILSRHHKPSGHARFQSFRPSPPVKTVHIGGWGLPTLFNIIETATLSLKPQLGLYMSY